jgi:PEP-CTERM motif
MMKSWMMKLFTVGLLVTAQQSLGAQTHSLGDQDPQASGFSTNSIFFGNARGWRFTANVSNITVTQLGIHPVTSGSYTLTLWDYAAQTTLAQTTIANVTGNSWNFANLASGVGLVAGNDYVVMGIGNTEGSTYYFGSGLPSSWYPTGDISYVDTQYCNDCSANSFPTQTLNGYQYGVVDIGYTTSTVPEPASLALVSFGAGVLGLIARRSRKRSPEPLA